MQLRICAITNPKHCYRIFFWIHLNPRAPDSSGNMIFLRNLLLDFRSKDLDLADMLKKTFTKHFVAWMNPTNVALNTHSKDPAFNLKDLQDPQQSLPENIDTESLAWQRASIKNFFSMKSKQAPCIKAGNTSFWYSVDNHKCTCERLIGKMSQCLIQSKIRDSKTSNLDEKIRSYESISRK